MTDMEHLPLANLDEDVGDSYEYHTTSKKLRAARSSNWKTTCCGVLLFLCVVAILGLCGTLVYVVLELKDANNQAASSSATTESPPTGSPYPSPSVLQPATTTASPPTGSLYPSPSVLPPANPVCLTESCVKLAGNVLSNMDASVDPCQDFYNFSCGGWVKRNVLPEGYGRWGRFNELDQQNSISLRHIIENDLLDEVDAISYARQLYYTCMDLAAIDSDSRQRLLNVINMTGGWDLVGVVNATAEPWGVNGEDFRASKILGNSAFFDFYVSVDDKNSSSHIPQLTQRGISLPSPTSYTDPNTANATLAALHTFMVSVLTLVNGGTELHEFHQVAADIIDFEKSLANIYVSNVDLRDPEKSYNLYQLQHLDNGELWSQFNWTQYMVEMFRLASVDIVGDLSILVTTPSYFRNLTELFEKTNGTVLENYSKWHLVYGYIPFMGSDFLDAYYAFTQVVSGTGKVERYKTCVGAVQGFAPMPLARLFTDYVLPPGTRGNVSDMVDAIKSAFVERLEVNDWIDDETRQSSIWKVGNISQMIAYPDAIYNDTYLLESSQAVNITRGQSYFLTAQTAETLAVLDNLKELYKPVNKSRWEIAPTEVNAYYEPLYNQFVFLEGILQPPFLDAAWPDYFKYGGMGVVVGHELSHGFDDQGQQYNEDGILTPWWTDASVTAFKDRQQCFVDQYSSYSVFGYNINGNLTLGENIADNGGLKTAFQAYKDLSANGPSPPLLPAIDLTPDQLFFVGFGQVWCTIYSPASIANSIKVDPHSPGPFRVVGAVSNSEEFASAFNCPPGSPMNPVNKCDLW